MKIFLCLLTGTAAAWSQSVGARYLAITTDAFYDDVKPLVEWKHRKGMRAKLVKLSETGYSAPEIRNYIINAYTTWTIPPEYILLVGAPNYLPMPYHYGTYSDNYYTDLNDDLFNDILSGRMTVHSSDEAKNVVNKILHYERWPDTTDRTWFTKACLIANTDGEWYSDSIYWENIHHYARLMTDTGFSRIDTLSNDYGNNAWDVINAVNDGRSYVLYRGTGVSNWYYPFDCDPSQTHNGYRLPIVLSITCATLGTGSTPAAAERWFLTGSVSEPRGAAGYFATTTVLVNGAHYRSSIAHGFADALFLEDGRTFGQACESGRKRVWTQWSNADEYRGYHTIGDPEMNLWISPPRRIEVTHPAVVMPGSNEIDIVVRVNGSPCPGATVCLVQCDTVLYLTAVTGPDGRAHFSFSVVQSDSISVTVTGPGLYPYESRMLVSFNGSYIAYQQHHVVDSLTGNGNQRLNPGETVQLAVWVKNYGIDSAREISAVLQPSDTSVTIMDSTAAYPDLAPGDSGVGLPPFLIRAADGLVDGYPAGLCLICRSTGDTTVSRFTVRICAPRIDFQRDSITGGNGNNTLEPGETANLIVALINRGRETAESLRATLRSTSPFLTVTDSLAEYGSLLPESAAINLEDLFTVSADTAAPAGFPVNLILTLTADRYRDTCQFRVIIGKKHFLLWNPDFTPEPGQAVYAALCSLGYAGDYSVNLPADLSLYQSVFVCLGVFPNNYLIGEGTPPANDLVNYLNNGGRVYLEGGDVWYWDPMAGGYDFCPLFGIIACSDGLDNMGPVAGDAGTFTRGMYFQYAGENQWMDQITGATNSTVIFRDANDGFDCGVSHVLGARRTVGTSFELGGLIDAGGVSTRRALLDSIMHFFGVMPGVVETEPRAVPSRLFLSVSPNPCRHRLTITVQSPMPGGQTTGPAAPTIRIYDLTGRLVKSLSVPAQNSNLYLLYWLDEDNHNQPVSPGVYFIKADMAGCAVIRKIVLVR